MQDCTPDKTYVRMAAIACALALVCIFTAGLWPFYVPRNAVSWTKNEPGLVFGDRGAAVSENAFRFSKAPDDTGFSLEFRATPALGSDGHGTILCFDSSPDPRSPFRIAQFGSNLVMTRYVLDDSGNVRHLWFKTSNVFVADKTIFVSVVSSKDRTDVYVDGVLKGTSNEPGIRTRELTGRLVLANSTLDNSWPGKITELAVYPQELTRAEIEKHYAVAASLDSGSDHPAALYRFDEGQGSVVHNTVDASTSLTIPARYFELHPAFLKWDVPQAMRWHGWSSVENLIINVGGFIPAGFIFCAYFYTRKRLSSPAMVVICVGFLLSLTVEVLQRFLPNRDSGIADLITNTVGTAFGVLLYKFRPAREAWESCLKYFASFFALDAAKPVSGSLPQEHETTCCG